MITIRGARENNLKNIDVTLPKNKLIALTGLSGSGKSTLAMETLQRECQRQYMESMGMTTEISSKAQVDSIVGLIPAISIHQSKSNHNPRSTVGTITEISPYLRVLFSTIAVQHCPSCHETIPHIFVNNSDSIVNEETSILEPDSDLLDEYTTCPKCGHAVVQMTPSHFSYNNPYGACRECKGVGIVSSPDPWLLIDKDKSIRDFAVHGWDQVFVDRYGACLLAAGKHYGFDIDITVPVRTYSQIPMDLLFYGVLSPHFTRHFPNVKAPKTVPEGRFEGVLINLMRRYEDSATAAAKQKFEKFLIQDSCPSCHGTKFRPEIMAVTLGGYNIQQVLDLPLRKTLSWLQSLPTIISKESIFIVQTIIETIERKLIEIIQLGGGYLCLSQASSSLSAGESQRIKLASILASNLTGVLYILDEPTTGLHGNDRSNIIQSLFQLRDKGNTVLIIEHDLTVIKAADYIVDFGPGAGKQGGEIVASGSLDDIISNKNSITGQYLSGKIPSYQRTMQEAKGPSLQILDAHCNNLKHLSIEIPLHQLVIVTGVSGAGKTSLVFDTIAKEAEAFFSKTPNSYNSQVRGFDSLDGVIMIDQSSMGRNSRSNPATYTDLFSDIRTLFGNLAKKQNSKLQVKDFSYNVAGGRCEKCQGFGKLTISMNFLPDVEVTCPKCHGKRYQKHVLAVTYHEHSIADILDLTVDEAIKLFTDEAEILRKLRILHDVGLGYLGLGQSSSTLSGGEAQRLKLAKELSSNSSNNYLYLFDEPSTGLHAHDAKRLLSIFDRLVARGNSVIVIEHNPEIIWASDWVIDLGPLGGMDGGQINYMGTPKKLILEKHPTSHMLQQWKQSLSEE